MLNAIPCSAKDNVSKQVLAKNGKGDLLKQCFATFLKWAIKGS